MATTGVAPRRFPIIAGPRIPLGRNDRAVVIQKGAWNDLHSREFDLAEKARVNLVIALHQLQKARRIVADGHRCVLEQQRLVDRLEAKNQNSFGAILLLEYLEEMQEQYESHRDRLERHVLGMVTPAAD
jgi:hypothetical protein